MRRHALLLGGSFLIAFVGADALIRATAGSSTRFERVLVVAAVVSLVGAAASAAALLRSWALYGAWAAAAILVACPPLAGHALDSDQPVVLAPVGDLLHVGAASVWVGGLASLLLLFPWRDETARSAAARRFSTFAIPMVLVLVAAGASRALTQLDSLSQLWETSYGQVLLLKWALLAVLLVLGWVNRRRLAAGFARLKPIVLAELLVLLVVVGAVGTLTDLRPGSARATAPTPTPPQVRRPPPAPPRGAFVDSAQAGPLAVGFAWRNGLATVTLTDRRGDAATRTPVTIDGHTPQRCGRGCFRFPVRGRTVPVTVGSERLTFRVPAELRPATAEVERLRADYDALSSIAILEDLSAGPGSRQVTRIRELAPDKRAYRITAASNRSIVGSEGIVIGDRRWDRLPGGPFSASPQAPVTVPKAYWTAGVRNAYYTADDEITFYDPTFPAWYRLRFDPATGHVDEPADGRDGPLHAARLLGLRPAAVDLAALAVALGLPLDELEEAGRVLEGGEAGGRVARAARRAAQAARRCDRAGRADEAAEHEGAEPGALPRGEPPVVAVHASILRC